MPAGLLSPFRTKPTSSHHDSRLLLVGIYVRNEQALSESPWMVAVVLARRAAQAFQVVIFHSSKRVKKTPGKVPAHSVRDVIVHPLLALPIYRAVSQEQVQLRGPRGTADAPEANRGTPTKQSAWAGLKIRRNARHAVEHGRLKASHSFHPYAPYLECFRRDGEISGRSARVCVCA